MDDDPPFATIRFLYDHLFEVFMFREILIDKLHATKKRSYFKVPYERVLFNDDKDITSLQPFPNNYLDLLYQYGYWHTDDFDRVQDILAIGKDTIDASKYDFPSLTLSKCVFLSGNDYDVFYDYIRRRCDLLDRFNRLVATHNEKYEPKLRRWGRFAPQERVDISRWRRILDDERLVRGRRISNCLRRLDSCRL